MVRKEEMPSRVKYQRLRGHKTQSPKDTVDLKISSTPEHSNSQKADSTNSSKWPTASSRVYRIRSLRAATARQSARTIRLRTSAARTRTMSMVAVVGTIAMTTVTTSTIQKRMMIKKTMTRTRMTRRKTTTMMRTSRVPSWTTSTCRRRQIRPSSTLTTSS